MLCQNCGKNEATFHYESNINGVKTERHLCSACAHESGHGEIFSHSGSDYMSSMLSDFFTGIPGSKPALERCPLCGATERDIASAGKAGCKSCYSVFSRLLTPYIHRIHGSARHTGKLPSVEGRELKAKRELQQLRDEMQKAVQAQEFEQAAQLRDKIRELEKEADADEQ